MEENWRRNLVSLEQSEQMLPNVTIVGRTKSNCLGYDCREGCSILEPEMATSAIDGVGIHPCGSISVPTPSAGPSRRIARFAFQSASRSADRSR